MTLSMYGRAWWENCARFWFAADGCVFKFMVWQRKPHLAEWTWLEFILSVNFSVSQHKNTKLQQQQAVVKISILISKNIWILDSGNWAQWAQWMHTIHGQEFLRRQSWNTTKIGQNLSFINLYFDSTVVWNFHWIWLIFGFKIGSNRNAAIQRDT